MEERPASVSVRRYRDDDAPAVAALWCGSWNGTGIDPGGRPSLRDYEERLAGEGRSWEIHLAVVGGRVRGFVAFQRRDGWLRQLFVAPGWQRIGLGRLLLDVAKTEMPEGFRLRTDEGNDDARRFYQRCGLVAGRPEVHPNRGRRVLTYTWPAPA